MKKSAILPIFFLLFASLLAFGCSQFNPTLPSNPAMTTPAPAITATPEPTPVPSPTPVAYEYTVASSAASYRFADDYGQVSEALNSVSQPAADIWSGRFASVEERAAVPEVAELSSQELSGDIIACGGNLLFILDDKDLVILSVTNGVCMPISRTEVGVNWTGGEVVSGTAVSGYEKTPLAVYPFGDRLAIIYDWYGYTGSAEKIEYTEYTAVDIYSISNPSTPVFLSSYGQGGTYTQSVLVRGVLYVVTDFPLYGSVDPQQISSFVPSSYIGGSATPLNPGQILLPETLDALDSGYTILGAYHLQNASMTDVRALLGTRGEMDIAEDGLRFLRHRWAESPSRIVEENGQYINEYAVAACTDILRISADGGAFTLQETKTVNGWIPNCGSIRVGNDSVEYVSELLQGLYSPDGQGGVLWRMTQRGIRLGASALYDTASWELDFTEEEGIAWAGLLDREIAYTTRSGESYLVHTDAETPSPKLLDTPVWGDVILPWGNDGYLTFTQPESGRLGLSVRDREFRELGARSFGSDHSNTLESRRSYFSDREDNLFGFAADDSYCFYSCEEGKGLTFRTDVFLQDWAWNTRAFRIGERIAVVNTMQVFLMNVETMKVYADYTV